MNEPTKVEKVFEGQPLAAYLWEGKPVWIAKEVGRVMGYGEEGKGLLRSIQDWKGELIEGIDFELLEGERLAKFKATRGEVLPESDQEVMGRSSPHQLETTRRELLLLKEPGFHLVCIKTEKKIGVRLRRWLAEEVMPSLLRTGAYQVDPKSREEVFDTYNLAEMAAMAMQASDDLKKTAKIYLKLVTLSQSKPTVSELAPPKEAIMRKKIEALDREHPRLGYTEIARRLGTTRGYISRVLRRMTTPQN